MDELKALDEFGTTLNPPTDGPPGQLRHRVLSQATQRSGRAIRLPRARIPRLGWRVALAGGLAAVLSAGLLVSQTLPREGGQQPASTASAAERILAGAAAQAQRQPVIPVRADQFVHVESIGYGLGRNRDGSDDLRSLAVRRQVWLSVDDTRDGLQKHRRADGSDESGTSTVWPGCREGKRTYRHNDGRKIVRVEPCTPSPAYRADLPTDADAMLAYLRARAGTVNPSDEKTFIAAADLIREAYLLPAALAAVFTAVSRIPGVWVVGDVTDRAGRAGVALALTRAEGTRKELIFDRQSHGYLGERSVLVRDHYDLTAGQEVSSSAQIKVAVVDRPGQLPPE